jgi:hypothetical protein
VQQSLRTKETDGMSKRLIVSLTGFKGSGKDTVGHMLQELAEFETVSFAAPLKAAVSHMFGWDRQLLEGHTQDSREWREQPDAYWSEVFGRTITPRRILQEFGTEVVRENMVDNFWIAAARKTILNSNKHVVITDARFPNELDMIRSLGGSCVRIKRGNNPWWYARSKRINSQPKWIKHTWLSFDKKLAAVHPSERDWIGYNFDHVLLNNQDKEQLFEQTQMLLKNLQQI